MPHDVDAVIAGVKQIFPTVDVEQLNQPHTGDDNGLWFFTLPGHLYHNIQIESSTYNCPFIVEHQQMTSTDQAICCHTVDETVTAIVSHLKKLQESSAP